MPHDGEFHSSIKCVGEIKPRIRHPNKPSLLQIGYIPPRTNTPGWVNGLRGLNYEERLKALKLQPLEKRGIRNDLALTHKILYNQIGLHATQLFKFSRRPGLRRSSLILLQQPGRIRRRTIIFECVPAHGNNLYAPLCSK